MILFQSYCCQNHNSNFIETPLKKINHHIFLAQQNQKPSVQPWNVLFFCSAHTLYTVSQVQVFQTILKALQKYKQILSVNAVRMYEIRMIYFHDTAVKNHNSNLIKTRLIIFIFDKHAVQQKQNRLFAVRCISSCLDPSGLAILLIWFCDVM